MTLTFKELCDNKAVRSAATYYYSSDGTGIYRYNHTYYNQQEFDKEFPVAAIEVESNGKGAKKENPDGTKSWMY